MEIYPCIWVGGAFRGDELEGGVVREILYPLTGIFCIFSIILSNREK